VLRNCEAFEYRNTDVGPLIRSAALERHRSGMTIGSAGLVHPKVYLLLAGRVRAVVTPPDGGAAVQVLAFEPGQFVLSRATLRGSPAPYALIADSEVEALALPVADFKAFCAADIKRANEIEQSLSVREEAAQRIMARTFPEQSAAALVGDRKKLVRDLFSNGASP
jgi:CRP-like cAMP-binding protein